VIPVVEIIRLETSKLYGTLSVLKINKKIFCFTLEPSKEDNKQFVSCIPTGQYTCKKGYSVRYKEVFEVMNVTDRTGILFHAGNRLKDTAGCFCLGQYPDKLFGDRGIKNSGKTFRAFMKKLEHYDEFHVTIKEEY
jgi:hypothetical protein